jgi:hypothetical protein
MTTTPALAAQLMLFHSSELPVTKQMLPKLIALLQYCHDSDKKANTWFCLLQQAIENHYRTEGNCLLFGDAKEILSGEMDYDMSY